MRSASLAQTVEGIGTGVPEASRRVASTAALNDQSDDVLITLVQSGETAAFRVLVERHQERVRNLIFSMFHEKDIVDDLAQEVFLKVYEALPQFRFESSFFTWVYRITLNKSRDEMRRRKVRRVLSLQSAPEQTRAEIHRSVVALPRESDLQDIVARGLQSLPEKFRTVIVLKDMEGMSYEEIAGIARCKIGTVKSRLARGRAMLRTVLKPLLEEA